MPGLAQVFLALSFDFVSAKESARLIHRDKTQGKPVLGQAKDKRGAYRGTSGLTGLTQVIQVLWANEWRQRQNRLRCEMPISGKLN